MSLTGLAKGAAMVLQLGANVVLARHLTELDYGIVGFAQVFVTLLNMLSEFGLSSAAIQQSRLSEKALQTGFTLRTLLGFIGVGAAMLLAPFAASMLDQAEVSDVIKLLSLTFLINAFAFVPSVRILRELDYRRFAIAQFVSALVNTIVTIALAVNGFSYWSIVIAGLAATAASVLYMNYVAGGGHRLTIEKQSFEHYRSFGGHVLLSWLLTFVVINLDNLVVGSVAGAAVLGLYALAFVWGSKLAETLGAVVNSVLFPTFSQIQDDKVRLGQAYLRSLRLVSFLALAGYTTLYVTSEDFLYFVLGRETDKWAGALVALQILCLYGVIRTLLEPVGSVVMALGGPAILVRANLLSAVLKLIMIYPALQLFGIEGVATVAVIAYAAQYLVFVPALSLRLGVGVADLLRAVRGSVLAAAMVWILMLALNGMGALGDASLLRFLLSVLLCGVAYIGFYALVSGVNEYREVWQTFSGSGRRVRST